MQESKATDHAAIGIAQAKQTPTKAALLVLK
jgi:hypothetical protein